MRQMAPGLALVSFNSRRHLEKRLMGLLEVAAQLDAPVAVVDNRSTDGSFELLSAMADQERLIVLGNRRNEGYAVAANQAARMLGQRDVLLVNPDVTVGSADEIAALHSGLNQQADTGVVGPRLIETDGRTQASARTYPSVLAMAGHASAAARWGPARRACDRYMSVPSADAPVQVDWVIGAAMMIRREAFERVGGFDEGFKLYLEDTDFCLRCAAAGWATVYQPSVEWPHEHVRASRPSAGRVGMTRERRRHILSMVRFFRKHPHLAFARGARS